MSLDNFQQGHQEYLGTLGTKSGENITSYKKAITKKQLSYDFTYMKHLKQSIHKQKVEWWLPGAP